MGTVLSCVRKFIYNEPFLQVEPPAEEEPDLPDEDSGGLVQAEIPHGLMNHGATCFLNSALQLLFMTPELHQTLEEPHNSTETDQMLKSLFEEMKKGPCGTEKLMHHLHISDHRQRDVAELLELLLNHLSPEVSEPFLGHITERTSCCEGHCVSEETALFWTLPLPLEHISGRTAAEALQQTLQQMALSGVFCEECGQKTQAQCSCELTKPPQILLLLLKRFDIHPRSGCYYKSQCEVELSPTLHTQDFSYSLVGAVDHWGSVSGGHYTATLLSMKDHSWYYFNDRTVEKAQAPTGHKYVTHAARQTLTIHKPRTFFIFLIKAIGEGEPAVRLEVKSFEVTKAKGTGPSRRSFSSTEDTPGEPREVLLRTVTDLSYDRMSPSPLTLLSLCLCPYNALTVGDSDWPLTSLSSYLQRGDHEEGCE